MVEYAYDAQAHLTAETYRDASGNVRRSAGYTYDAVGNRLTLTGGGLTVSYTYNANDQLLSDGATAYAYDANGNNVSKTSAGFTTRYDYDARDRLARVTQPNGSNISYAYDAAGNHVRAIDASGSVTNYVVDPTAAAPQVLVETDGAGRVVASYTYGLDLISQRRNGADSFYVQDGLGSVRVLTDASGVVTDTYTYDAFGRLLASTGTTANSFRFAGEQSDADTGLYYMRARYYDPAAGRFAAMDAYRGRVGDPRTQHRYTYAQNDPVNQTDPTGLFTLKEGMELHGVIGNYYLREWGDYWDTRGVLKPSRSRFLKGVPAKPPDFLDGWGAYDRYVRSGFPGLGLPGVGRPDLRNYYNGDVYEIKPLSGYGWQSAQDEAEYYAEQLNAEETALPILGPWQEGSGYSYPTIKAFPFQGGTRMALTVSFPLTAAGTIYYMEVPRPEDGAEDIPFSVFRLSRSFSSVPKPSVLKAGNVAGRGLTLVVNNANTQAKMFPAEVAMRAEVDKAA